MQTIRACRSCASSRLEKVLSLGEQPLANALLRKADLEKEEPRFPLTLAVCHACSLGQILETLPPDTLFSDYVYFSSYSDGMLRHARESTAELIEAYELGADSLAVEVASNDGYQLRFFQAAGVPVLGIEPAANVAEAAERMGIPTRVEFFGLELARQLVAEGVRADLVLGYNVLAHVADLNGFVAGLRTLLGDDGVAVIEVPYAGSMLEMLSFDTIYHEHLCYFSLTALHALFARHGLEIHRAAEIELHGGSLRLHASAAGRREVEAGVGTLLARERETGMADASAWRGFGERVAALREELVALVNGLHDKGQRIAAYGAAAKGATLLNYFGIDAGRIAFVADRSPHKQGRYMPGVRIPITDAAALDRERPDCCLLLAWNFADEILAQQAAWRRGGGRFIVPLPEPRLI